MKKTIKKIVLVKSWRYIVIQGEGCVRGRLSRPPSTTKLETGITTTPAAILIIEVEDLDIY